MKFDYLNPGSPVLEDANNLFRLHKQRLEDGP